MKNKPKAARETPVFRERTPSTAVQKVDEYLMVVVVVEGLEEKQDEMCLQGNCAMEDPYCLVKNASS